MALGILIFWVVLSAFLLLLITAALRPDQFRVQRSLTIAAPASAVHALISDFHHWPQWSPWEQLDPNLQRTYGGAARGLGATYAWSGNGKAGAGCMEIKVCDAHQIVIQLDFSKPFVAHNTAEFVLTPAQGMTTVQWAMFGPSPFVARLMGLFFSMDRLVGRDFEKGLARLQVATSSNVPVT